MLNWDDFQPEEINRGDWRAQGRLIAAEVILWAKIAFVFCACLVLGRIVGEGWMGLSDWVAGR